MKDKKKHVFYTELAYVFALPLMSLGIALSQKADLGMSMISAPAYLFSLWIEPLSFGTAEYLLQAVLLAGMCAVIGRFKASYLLSFVTAFLYGTLLDLFVWLLSFLPGGMVFRCVYFVVGAVTISFSVALFFRAYFPPGAYELFVKEVAERFAIKTSKLKICFDCSFLVLSVVLSLLFFRGFRGIGVGTLICAVANGPIIGAFGNMLDKSFTFSDKLPLRSKIK